MRPDTASQMPSAFSVRGGVAARSDVLLSVDGVGHSFGGLRALDDVSFSVAGGGVTSIIGPNGAGKTTLFNVLSGTVRVDEGSIRYWGEEVSHLSAHRRARLGIARTFQNSRFFGSLTVSENVLVGSSGSARGGAFQSVLLPWRERSQRRELRDRSVMLLRRVGVAEKYWDRAPHELPYAEQRRVEIARGLATSPQLLLLDEPTVGMLDAEVNGIKSLIREMIDDGLTVLLIEHNVPMVMALSDHVVVMEFGRKIAEGDTDAVRNDAGVVAAYLGADDR